MLSSLYSHTDPTIEDASVINDILPPILEDDILLEDEDIFADPSTSKFEKSKTDCSDENHYARMEVLEQIQEKFQKFINLCSRYDPFRPWWTHTHLIKDIPDRTTVDPFRQPE